jgi:hypothetical protein
LNGQRKCNKLSVVDQEISESGFNDELTIFLWGSESSRFLRTGSALSFSYGNAPCTQAWNTSQSKS